MDIFTSFVYCKIVSMLEKTEKDAGNGPMFKIAMTLFFSVKANAIFSKKWHLGQFNCVIINI